MKKILFICHGNINIYYLLIDVNILLLKLMGEKMFHKINVRMKKHRTAIPCLLMSMRHTYFFFVFAYHSKCDLPPHLQSAVYHNSCICQTANLSNEKQGNNLPALLNVSLK